jgi:S1-C subfamily serine protease
MARALTPISLRRALTGAFAVAVAAVVLTGVADGAPAAKTPGIVVVETRLAYGSGAAAGTGIVVSSSGVVLTNNHVIRGADSVRVTDPSTGKRYSATVAGYTITGDVAVLRLAKASGVPTAALGTSSRLRVGQSVTAVGNAGGTGRLVTSAGTIRALGQAITVRDDQGGSARLTGLIRTNASLQPGDSGGPLFDASGRVIGINTAASGTFTFRTSSSQGYAIPIDRARAVAKAVRAGRSTAQVHVGPTAFLGILTSPARDVDTDGALVADVVPNGPADRAGIGRGSLITRIGGKAVSSVQSIVTVLQRKKPGQTISVIWLDTVGNRTTSSVRLVSGPPQ